MRRLQSLFDRRRRERRCVLGTYVMAGDPDPGTSLAVLHALVEAGSDVLELGYPYSDPVLDGAVIRGAHRRVLQRGASLRSVLELVRKFRRSNRETPVILMGYSQPILAQGEQPFVQAAARAGVDALLVADLPVKEASQQLLPALMAEGMCLIPLAAPGLCSSDLLLEAPGIGGFLYCIPSDGPTGGPSTPIEVIRAQVRCWQGKSSLPIGIGFGVKNAAFAAEVAVSADAVFIGSALVERIAEWLQTADPERATLLESLGGSVRGVRAGMDLARHRGVS